MKLEAAIASGKKFTSARLGGDVYTADDVGEDFIPSAEDILADDYVLVGDGITVTPAQFATAWDTVRTGFTSVKPSGQSGLYKALLAHLTATYPTEG